MAAEEGLPCILGAVVVCLGFNTGTIPCGFLSDSDSREFFLIVVEPACCSS